MQNFGEKIRDIRIAQRVSLRNFCKALNIDASRWSKIERGVLPPPSDKDILGEIAKILGIKHNSDEWVQITDLASISRGRLPDDIASNTKLMQSLPVLFRTIRDEEPTEEELRTVARLIRESNESND